MIDNKNIHPKIGQKTMRVERVSRNRLKTYVWHSSTRIQDSCRQAWLTLFWQKELSRQNVTEKYVGGWVLAYDICLLFCLLRNTLGLSRQIQLTKLAKYCMSETAILVE